MNTYQRMKAENEKALTTIDRIDKLVNDHIQDSLPIYKALKSELDSFWKFYGKLNCPRIDNGKAK